jgi:hypothetical protein
VFFLVSKNEIESHGDQREVLQMLQVSPDMAKKMARHVAVH